MRVVVMGLTILLGAGALAQPSDRSLVPIPGGKVRDATSKIYRITHLRTGQVVYPQEAVPRNDGPVRVAFDNMSWPCDPNGTLLNLNYSDAAGQPLCACPIDPNDVVFAAGQFTMADEPCEDPDLPGGGDVLVFPGLGVTDPLDQHIDNYRMDPAVAGPNELVAVVQFDSTFTYLGSFGPGQPDDFSLEIAYVFYEGSDVGNDGLLDALDGVVVHFQFDANDAGGLFDFSLTADSFGPNFPGFTAAGCGWIAMDFRDVFDLAGGGSSPACGVGNIAAGGRLNQPSCATPQEWVTVGSVDVPSGDVWYFANDTQAAQSGPPYDPNLVRGASEDALNYGLLLNLDLGFSRDVPRRLTVSGGRGCGPGCAINAACADVNDDGMVDLADLAIVLGNFGGTGPGDTDGAGSVDLTDLANVLTVFGADCW